MKTPRDVITGTDNWCRRFAAMDAAGDSIQARSPFAVQWCLIGACHKACAVNGGSEYPFYDAVLAAIVKLYNPDQPFIAKFNDDPATTIEMVLAVLAEAFPRKEAE